MTDSSTGPDLGPRPAEDGVPAFDETYEWISESPGQEPIKVQAGVIYVRDPRHALELNRLQTQAIMDVLTWVRQYRLEVEAGTRCPGRKTPPAHCVRCLNAEPGTEDVARVTALTVRVRRSTCQIPNMSTFYVIQDHPAHIREVGDSPLSCAGRDSIR